MKTQSTHYHRAIIASAAASLILVSPVRAAPYTWDTVTGDGASITEGSGTWQVGVGNWNDLGSDVPWADGNEAIFGGGTAGTAGTVTLGGNVAPSLLTFHPPNAGTYTIDLGSSTLVTPDTFAAVNLFGNTSATIVASGGGNFVTNYTGGAWNFNLTGSLTIDAPITGAGRVSTAGAGNLTLTNPANDFTGLIRKQNGGNLSFASIADSGVASAAGAGSEVLVGYNARLVYTGGGDSTNRTLAFFGANNGTLANDGAGALIWTGPFSNDTSGTAGNRNFTLGGANTGDNEFRGVLADHPSNGNTLSLLKNDAGTWLLTGDNTYTGTTTVSAGILKVNHDNALGSPLGATTVATNAKLYLEGGAGDLTIPEDLTIGGGSGVINNRAGSNTITGLVTLSAGADTRRAAGRLTFAGGITSGAANHGISLNMPTTIDTSPIDLNAGTLTITSNGNSPANGSELNVGGNDWGLLRINFGGHLTLGAANVLPADSNIEFGWHMQNSSSGTLDLNGFDQTVASIGVTPIFPNMMGDQRITGGGTLTVNQATTTEYQGRITDGATPTKLVKDGRGTLILNNLSGIPSSYTGTTTVNAGILQAGTASSFGGNSAVTVASGATVALDGHGNAIGSLAGAGTVENAGPGTTVLDDDFEGGSVTNSGVRLRERDIDDGWHSRFNSAWTITGGQIENASTVSGGYPGATPAESALVQMFTNTADGRSVTLQFDYDVAAGDTLYVHLRGHVGTPVDGNLIVGNTEPCNGAYYNDEFKGTQFTEIDAFNLKSGATGFPGVAGDALVALTGSGTSSTVIDIAALGIDGINGLAGFSHLSLAFCKDEDGNPGTTSIDKLSITTTQATLSTGGDDTDTTFAGVMQDGAGTLGLRKVGAGTLTLTAANTYTGLTTVSGGTLQIGDGGTTGSLSPASAITIAAGGTLCFDRSDTVTQGVDFSGSPIAGPGTFAVKGGGTVVVTNNATFSSDTTVSVAAGSTLELDFGGTNSVATLILDGVSYPVGVYDSAHPSGLLTGTGTLAVTTPPESIWDGGGGDANWQTAANWAGDFAPVPPAILVFAGTVNTATNNDFPAGSSIHLIEFPNTGAGESFSLGGNAITLEGDILTSPAGGNIADSISLGMELNGDRTIKLGESHDLGVTGIISEDASARALTKRGPGTLTLAAANTYSGNTNLFEGTTVVTNDNAFGTSPLIDLRDDEHTGTTLVLAADGLAIPHEVFIRNSGGTRTIRLDVPGSGTAVLSGQLTVNEAVAGNFVVDADAGDSLEISGNIITTAGGGAGLTKEGPGTLVLSGTNTYVGYTNVNGGTLLINGSHSGEFSTVTVADNATFGGGGSIEGSLVAREASAVTPGAPVGTLSTGNAVNISGLAGGTGTLHFDLGPLAGPNDLIDAGGDLVIGSGALGISDFAFHDLGGIELGTYPLITSNGITGTLDASDLTGSVGEAPMKATLRLNGTSLELVVTILDTDGDGISDTYESANTNPSSPTALDPSADDDGDGFTNFAEARFGTISLAATGAGSFPQLIITSADPGGTNVATLALRPAFEGIEYQLLGSMDLVLYSVIDGNGGGQPGLANTATSINGTTGVITFIDQTALRVPFKGYRVEVIHNPNQP